MAQWVKNLPAIQETRVRSLDWEDPLEQGMATHSSNLSWEISWTEEPGHGVEKIWTRKQLSMSICLALLRGAHVVDVC